MADLQCPNCRRSTANTVIDSRLIERQNGTSISRTAIRRRRRCHNCGERWTTFELPEGNDRVKRWKRENGLSRDPRNHVFVWLTTEQRQYIEERAQKTSLSRVVRALVARAIAAEQR